MRPVLIGLAVLGVLEVVEGRKAEAYSLVPDSVANSREDFEKEPGPILNRAAILVSTSVDVVVEKLLQEVAIGA